MATENKRRPISVAERVFTPTQETEAERPATMPLFEADWVYELPNECSSVPRSMRAKTNPGYEKKRQELRLRTRALGDPGVRQFMEKFDCQLVDVKDLKG